MEGETLHEWSRAFGEIWPSRASSDLVGSECWRDVHVYPDGGLLAMFDGLGLVRLNRDSSVLWSYAGACHDDLCVSDDGLIYILEQRPRSSGDNGGDGTAEADVVTVLTADGERVGSVDILRALRRSQYAPLEYRVSSESEGLGANAMHVLDATLSDVSDAFSAGNLLLSLGNVESVVVLDPSAEKIVWAMTGRWRGQHAPALLPSGRLLVFNNEAGPQAGGGAYVGPRESAVVELDPFTQVTHWSYPGSSGGTLYSETAGFCQRLPNGNTLVTESDAGRAVEVTPEGRVVWEYLSSFRAGAESELVATLLKVQRMSLSLGEYWTSGSRVEES
jgi:hypothetical protein